MKLWVRCVSFISLAALLNMSVGYAQSSRLWTIKDGNSFTATIVKCDKETATFKIYGEKKPLEVSMAELSEDCRRDAILEYYKPRYFRAINALQGEANRHSKDIFLNEQHVPYLNDIGMYLKELVRPVAEKFKPEGEYDESDDYWTRVHSGMVYFAITWLDELSNNDAMLKLGESRRPKLKDTVRHIKDFHEFFVEIANGKNYFKNRLGRQFPVKFKPKNYVHDNQPYHYWVYLPKDYGEKPMPLVFFLCGIGEFGTSLDAVLTNDLPKMLETRTNYPFIVISPQDNDRISRPPYFNEILDDVKKRFYMDEDRVIGTGLSSGGTGVWRWALANPEVFAGIVPVCAVMPFEEIKQLKDMPIWLFNNEYDNVWIQEIGIANMRHNPNFKYRIYKEAQGHDAWSRAYKEKGMEKWMSELNRKNNKDNSAKVLDSFPTVNSLTEPVVKNEKLQNYLTLTFDPSSKGGAYSDIVNEHTFRCGSMHDSILYEALSAIYNFQHFELRQSCTPGAVRFMDAQKPDDYNFGIPIKNFQKVDVKPPFEVQEKPPFKCYAAYYVSENETPDAALYRLRRMAEAAGHQLTGRDRIVYLQMLVADRNIYELQVGIK